jgi:beta-glucuronidase
MLNLTQNNYRSKSDISGFWDFKVDKNAIGEKENWFNEFNGEYSIAVPGSWNEQLEAEGLMNYIGDAWYHKEFFVTGDYVNKNVFVRIDSADYQSKIWINGNLIGENLGGFLPIEFDITEYITPNSNNNIVVKVNNELNSDTIPQGIKAEDYTNENRLREETFPPARFDFFPYGGINRPVYIYSTPKDYIKDIKVLPKIIDTNSAVVKIDTNIATDKSLSVKYEFIGEETNNYEVVKIIDKKSTCEIVVDNCRFWNLDDPYLYKLKVQLLDESVVIDEYILNVGVREIKIENNNLFINGEKVFLKGFGKHEDFPVLGKGLSLPLIVKDFSLLKWINANSFRTSHYPYAEEWLDYADKNGVLVIDEIPAVSLDFRKTTDQTLQNHKDFIKKLIDRDFNHPSVIMWAPGNEPNLVGEKGYYQGSGEKYWNEIYNYTKSLDDSRPITIPNCQRAGVDDPVFNNSDVISMNRYYGWYENPGNLETAIKRMESEMDLIAEKYNKPIIVTEFGADTVAGQHSVSDQMFTEEYQSNLLELYCKLIESKDYTIGEHVWNFADFKTPQHFRRVVNNLKGVFTRTRDPKQAAFTLKRIWSDTKSQ